MLYRKPHFEIVTKNLSKNMFSSISDETSKSLSQVNTIYLLAKKRMNIIRKKMMHVAIMFFIV